MPELLLSNKVSASSTGISADGLSSGHELNSPFALKEKSIFSFTPS